MWGYVVSFEIKYKEKGYKRFARIDFNFLATLQSHPKVHRRLDDVADGSNLACSSLTCNSRWYLDYCNWYSAEGIEVRAASSFPSDCWYKSSLRSNTHFRY